MYSLSVFFTAIIILFMMAVAESLFAAQLIVWGLAQYHIHSGILGPWLILSALTMLAGITSYMAR